MKQGDQELYATWAQSTLLPYSRQRPRYWIPQPFAVRRAWLDLSARRTALKEQHAAYCCRACGEPIRGAACGQPGEPLHYGCRQGMLELSGGGLATRVMNATR